MSNSDHRSDLVAKINQALSTGLWGFVVLGWGVEFLSCWGRRPGEFHEPYGWALGLLAFPFALAFHLAAVGWRRQAPWRWIAQLAPAVVILSAFLI